MSIFWEKLPNLSSPDIKFTMEIPEISADRCPPPSLGNISQKISIISLDVFYETSYLIHLMKKRKSIKYRKISYSYLNNICLGKPSKRKMKLGKSTKPLKPAPTPTHPMNLGTLTGPCLELFPSFTVFLLEGFHYKYRTQKLFWSHFQNYRA